MLNPAEFAYRRLGLDPYPWQVRTLLAIGRREKVALVAANESGKTALVVAASVLWFLETFPRGRVVITSGVFRQVKEQLWRALETHRDKYPGWTWNECNIRTPEGGFAIGFATDDAGRAEGWHSAGNMGFVKGWDEAMKKDDWPAAMEAIATSRDSAAPLYYVVDEAKTVKEGTFGAVDRCGPQYRLYVSSPGAPYGQFFRCFAKERKFFWTCRVTSMECPHISAAKRNEDRERYGEASPLFRSMHLAEFSENEEGLVMTAQALELALAVQPDPSLDGESVAFCDFARGGDENVIAARRGNTIRILDSWRESDTMKAVRRFIRVLRDNAYHPGEVWGDASGLGGPICDRFAELDFPLNEFNGGLPAIGQDGPAHYANLISQAWFEGAAKLGRHEFCFPDGMDPMTFEQITSRPTEWDSKGRMAVMPKSRPRAGAQGEEGRRTMKAIGLPSPDRADAVFGCMIAGGAMTGAVSRQSIERSSIPRSQVAPRRVRF